MEPLFPINIELPARERRTLLHELHRQLRTGIVEGRLCPGLRLPSTRAAAEHFRISRNTMIAVYDRLMCEGYLVARRGSGTEVAHSLPKLLNAEAGGTAGEAYIGRLAPFWREVQGPGTGHGPPVARWAFRLGVPDAATFPVEVWRRLAVRESRSMRSIEAFETHLAGLPALRQAIARHVSFTRAVACSAEDIIVTAGAQQAFDLLARVLVVPHRTCVALESPGYAPLRRVFEAARSKLSSIPVDNEGLIVDRLPGNAEVVCVTPSHQFPLGCALGPRRRAALLDFAASRNAVIIEDDYDGEFRYLNRPLDALQTLDRHDSVIYVGTFSKSLLPNLRLGYMVAPAWARGPLLAAKASAAGSACFFTQGILAALISEGHLARHVRKMQSIYARRRQLLLDGLHQELAPWLKPIPAAAGLHVAARLASGLSDQAVVAAALTRGLGVSALSSFCVGRSTESGLALGFGAISDSDIAPALRVLRQTLARGGRHFKGIRA